MNSARKATRDVRNSRRSLLQTTLCGILFVGSAATASAQDAVLASGLISTRGIAVNSTTGSIYGVDSRSGTITVIDGKSHNALMIAVGKRPLAIAVNSVTDRIYVANAGSGTVSVLDGANNTILATVDVGAQPYVLAADEANNKVYVSNTYSSVMTVIDGATNSTSTIKSGSADAMYIDAKTNNIYLLGYEDANLTLMSGADGSRVKLPLGAIHLWGIAPDEARQTLYVTRIGSGDIVAMDERSHHVVFIATGKMPCALAVNSKTNTVYVANYQDGTVTVIDGGKHIATNTIAVGRHPQAIALDSTANRIYVANTLDSTVSVIDGSSNKVLATVAAGQNPYAFAIEPRSGNVYAATLGEPSVRRIQVDTRP
jgi:YVTN family beta-propeller protein